MISDNERSQEINGKIGEPQKNYLLHETAETVEKVQMAIFNIFGIVKIQQLTGQRKP
jgi:hypothetical protein